jgi:hypothetical protein
MKEQQSQFHFIKSFQSIYMFRDCDWLMYPLLIWYGKKIKIKGYHGKVRRKGLVGSKVTCSWERKLMDRQEFAPLYLSISETFLWIKPDYWFNSLSLDKIYHSVCFR